MAFTVNNDSLLGQNAQAPQGSEVLDLTGKKDTQQVNVQGQSVAPTASSKGVDVSVDPQGDKRSPLEYKQDQHSINTKFTSTPDEANDDNSIIGERSGHRYQKVEDGLAGQLIGAAIAYGATYYATDGNVAQASLSSGKVLNEHLNVLHRQSQIQEMEKEGLAPVDIETFIQSGNKKDLNTNKGKWINIGGGWVMNENTGEKTQAYNEMDQFKEKETFSAQVKNQFGKPDVHYIQNKDGSTTAIDNRTNQPVAHYDQHGNAVDNSGDDGTGIDAGMSGGATPGAGADTNNANPFPNLPATRGVNPNIKRIQGDEFAKPVASYRQGVRVQADLDHALNSTDPNERNAAVIAAGDGLTRMLVGGNASLTPEAIRELSTTPELKAQYENLLAVKSGHGNTDQAIKFMQNIANTSMQGYRSVIRDTMSTERDNMQRYETGNNPHQATFDIMTQAGVSPDMFMNPEEQKAWNEKHVWTKTGALNPHKKSAPAQSKQVQIPSAAISRLRANPGEAAHFDEVFGQGAAAQVLGSK